MVRRHQPAAQRRARLLPVPGPGLVPAHPAGPTASFQLIQFSIASRVMVLTGLVPAHPASPACASPSLPPVSPATSAGGSPPARLPPLAAFSPPPGPRPSPPSPSRPALAPRHLLPPAYDPGVSLCLHTDIHTGGRVPVSHTDLHTGGRVPVSTHTDIHTGGRVAVSTRVYTRGGRDTNTPACHTGGRVAAGPDLLHRGHA